MITNDELETIAEGPDIVVHATPDELGAMEEVVRSMHTRSGLLLAIQSSPTSLAEAGDETLAFLRAHIGEPRSVPLCGNSIGTDRRFLAAHLPEVENFLHYRSIDVSSVKELCRRWYPDVLAGAPPKKETHRALGRHPRVDRGARVLPLDDLHRSGQFSISAVAGASSSRTHEGTAAARAVARRPRIATTSTTTVALTNTVAAMNA